MFFMTKPLTMRAHVHLFSAAVPAGQFAHLHSLSVDFNSKACTDVTALRYMRGLKRLHLAQFSFADEAIAAGPGSCCGLEVLHLESQQVRGIITAVLLSAALPPRQPAVQVLPKQACRA